MTAIWASRAPEESPPEAPAPAVPDSPAPSADSADVADTGLADLGLRIPGPPVRPQLQRDQPQPPPPHQPPPPPAPQNIGNPADSLSLSELRRIVNEFPKNEPTAYAFEYDDTATYEEEIEEWFSYNDAEFERLRRAQNTFRRRWNKLSAKDWLDATPEAQSKFIQRQVTGLQTPNLRRRCKALQALLYLVLGVWEESAGKPSHTNGDENKEDKKPKTPATEGQLRCMRTCMLQLTECGALPAVWDVFRNAFERLWDAQILEEDLPFMQDELDNVTTILYVFIESARKFPKELAATYKALLSLNPRLSQYLMTVTARLRWDDANELPHTRIFLLFWKSLLLLFGSSKVLQKVKDAVSEIIPEGLTKKDLITTSPLDYHMFRQEIISKYPAYTPPAPLIPLEADSNSIIPPLSHQHNRYVAPNGIIAPPDDNSGAGSILHQPVHIATPAPSPPPSPGVGGKAGKKQNYQTNQSFPFMYPPLDSTSSSAGGKGSAGMQDAIVGRKWEGSDIPTSIIEAGELFARRMRMTRALRQLWDERERYLKFERGWDEKKMPDDDVEELDLETILAEKPEVKDQEPKLAPLEVDYGPRQDIDPHVKDILDDVESFYKESLPHLQSLVIVLLKSIIANAVGLATQAQAANRQANPSGQSFDAEGNARANGSQPQRTSGVVPDVSDLSVTEVEALRSREITAKALSGILLTLLKWFKVSHVLKYEYLTQLLLDANYLPVTLKMFAHQDVDKMVDSRSDREELSVFTFCNKNSRHVPPERAPTSNTDFPTTVERGEESEDDAAPPPIKRKRDDVQPMTTADGLQDGKLPAISFQDPSMKTDPSHSTQPPQPQVDELGCPINPMPPAPLEIFSFRNFFSTITLLRIMQKIVKDKPHRNLLLVQYKSSAILKKALKIPQHELRLYTLKVFKGQVPYCGRKWRSGNMKVITAVYLHVRPGLREYWLAGGDVDREVEESVSGEQAIRALTYWHNVRRYPEEMGFGAGTGTANGTGEDGRFEKSQKSVLEQKDFFTRELEKMEVELERLGGWDAESEMSESEMGSMWEASLMNGW